MFPYTLGLQVPDVHTQRFQFLDALRGFAIVGMIMVNTPGSWAHVHPWLRHACRRASQPACALIL